MENEPDTTAPRRLHRRSSGRMLAGVAGGLGDYTGVDPVFFRIGFIVLSVAGGSGVLLYALGWLLIPEENEAPVAATFAERLKGRRAIALIVVGICALFLADWMQNDNQTNWNFLGAIALLAIGFVLLRDEPDRSQVASTEAAPTTTSGVPVVDARARRPKRARSPLGFMTLGAAFVAVSLAAILMGANVVELRIGQFVALVVMTIGLGLVVGGWWGRARLLVLLAMLLTPVMVVASMIDVPLKGSINQNQYLELRRDVAREYEVMFGTLTLDFSRFRFGEKPTEVDLLFGVGDVSVYVPPGVDVTVKGEVDLGFADVFGERYEGKNMTFDDDYHREGLSEGELIINVDGGLASFDTTWARWVDQNIRMKQRKKERREQREQKAKRDERAEVKKDGRGRDSN